MGLTIHAMLSLKAEDSAHSLLENLRKRCLDLPFLQVDDRLDDLNEPAADKLHRNLRIHAETALEFRHEGQSATLKQGLGFVAVPGRGCEPLYIGLVKACESDDWSWLSGCKTQYANDPVYGGRANFLRCHLSIVALLDAACAMGLGVKVIDEGEYWVHRDVHRLEQNLAEYDAMVAGFTGAMKDEGLNVQGAMLGRPDFERLEAEGLNRYPQQIRDLITLTRDSLRQTGL